MNLRNDGLKWFEEHHNSREPIRVSKFYPAHESWKKGPVWWFEFPPHDVSNPNGWINLLCQRQNDPSSFHHLHIPMGLFAGCKHLIGFREDKNVYSLFLSAEPESLFREMRGSGNIEFGVFEHDCKFNTFAQVTLESWEDIHEYSKQGWIYRGQRSVDWSLQTSLERCYNRHSIPKDRYSEVESDLLRAFRRAYHHYSQHVPSPTDTIEWLSLMQHHGTPTRLLDFTYSIYVASYFAIEAADHDAAVWAVDGRWALRESAKLFEAAGKDHSAVQKLQDRFVEGSESITKNLFFESPLVPLVWPMNPFRLNERLRIQKGVFLMAGSVEIPFIENLTVLPDHDKQDKILKIVIPKSCIEEALVDLYNMNITRASLFPGLDGYAQALGVHHPSYRKGGMFWYDR